MKNEISLQGRPYVTVKSVTKKPNPSFKKAEIDIQGAFLREVVGKIITVKLLNGEEVTGQLKFYDKWCLRLEHSDRYRSLVYKSGICRIEMED